MTKIDVLELSIHIDAQPETVFPYFTDPDRYARMDGRASEPRPGSRWDLPGRDGQRCRGIW